VVGRGRDMALKTKLKGSFGEVECWEKWERGVF
jgi:hypothetical protein